MTKHPLWLFSLVCCSFSIRWNDVAAADPTTITCRTGWTEGTETGSVPAEWINDGYCDCPFDGKDEPETNACSGSLSWPGVESSSSAASSDAASSSDYVCPKQPDVVLPSSRLHDGICDCCDGSDEERRNGAPNPCPDDCDRILRAERERKARIHNNYLIGSRKRELDLAKFEKLRSKKLVEISKLEGKLSLVQAEIDDIEGNHMVKMKGDYARARAATVKNFVLGGSMAKALVSGLETRELNGLLVPLCQVAGEIARSDGRMDVYDDEDTAAADECLALRVAALDIGLTWSGEGSDLEATLHDPASAAIAPILFENALETTDGLSPPLRYELSPSSANKKKKKPRKTPKGRRRLDEMMDDDYGMMMMMDDDDDDTGSMRHPEDDEDFDEQPPSRNRGRSAAPKKAKTDPRLDAVIKKIRASLFSATRDRFLEESQEALDEIAKILDDAEQRSAGKDDEGVDDGGGGDDEEAAEAETDDDDGATEEGRIDVAPYEALRERLLEKREIVEAGLRWGASASFLLDAPLEENGASTYVSQSRSVTEALVVGTIFHGRIGSVEVWRILQSVLPELKGPLEEFVVRGGEAEATTATCASPWAGSCPPRSVPRGGGGGEYPPAFLVEVARTFCDEEASSFGKDASHHATLACRAKNDDDGDDDDENVGNAVVESLASLPPIEGGNRSYFGYSAPTRRDESTDPLEGVFEPLVSLPVDVQGLRSLEDERDEKEAEHRTISDDIESGWKEIGGEDRKALGRDGELHPFVDQCFDIVAGKYTYAMCIFGQAHQREGGRKTGGTKLGTFEGIEYNDDDGGGGSVERDGVAWSTRVLRWKNGAKCWNGPMRSATVYLTCGPENKVVSANEPDTCRYVFEMESHVACDEAYKAKMGL